MKIKSITLKNFRGVKEETTLKADSKSVLLYGDNGTGKSSFLDAIEWFLTGSVKHLGGQEKNNGLRNTKASDDEASYVTIRFTNNIENTKNLTVKKGVYKSTFTDTKDQKFSLFKDVVEKNPLWIRNNQLIEFILKSEQERLANISDIVGYDQVKKARDEIKKSIGSLNKVVEYKNLKQKIPEKQEIITKELNQTAYDPIHFYSAVESKIKDYKLGINIKDQNTLDQAIKQLTSKADPKVLKDTLFLKSIEEDISNLKLFLKSKEKLIKDYFQQANNIQNNSKELKNISLISLYKEAQNVLSHHTKDKCPLCTSEIKKEKLLQIISDKLKALQTLEEKKSQFEMLSEEFLETNNHTLKSLESIEKKLDEILVNFDFKISISADDIKNILDKNSNQIKKSILDLRLKEIDFNIKNILSPLDSVDQELKEKLKDMKVGDNSKIIATITSINNANNNFKELSSLKREEKLINEQQETLRKLFEILDMKIKDSMNNLLKEISEDVNSFYTFMNSGNKVKNIKLSIGNDTSDGVEFTLDFYNKETQLPRKFLSESQVNCLGLSLFLASVKFFSKHSKFIILDDVISSFDKNHRIRFAQLLTEKFQDYQLIVLTHETDWFTNYMAPLAKSKGWCIKSVKWNEDTGSYLEIPLVTYREKIDKKIKNQDTDGLGNLLRQYLESVLKELCFNLKAKLPYKFDEKRTLRELLDGFRERIKKKIPEQSSIKPILERIQALIPLQNTLSHDSPFQGNLEDLVVVYEDIKKFEDFFKCIED